MHFLAQVYSAPGPGLTEWFRGDDNDNDDGNNDNDDVKDLKTVRPSRVSRRQLRGPFGQVCGASNWTKLPVLSYHWRVIKLAFDW